MAAAGEDLMDRTVLPLVLLLPAAAAAAAASPPPTCQSVEGRIKLSIFFSFFFPPPTEERTVGRTACLYASNGME